MNPPDYSGYPTKNEFIDLETITKGLEQGRLITTNFEVEDKPNKALQVFYNIITCGIYYLVRKKNHDVEIIADKLVNDLEKYANSIVSSIYQELKKKISEREECEKKIERFLIYLESKKDDEILVLDKYLSNLAPLSIQDVFKIRTSNKEDPNSEENKKLLEELIATKEYQDCCEHDKNFSNYIPRPKIGEAIVVVNFYGRNDPIDAEAKKILFLTLNKFKDYIIIWQKNNQTVSVGELRKKSKNELKALNEERSTLQDKLQQVIKEKTDEKKQMIDERIAKTQSILNVLKTKTHKEFLIEKRINNISFEEIQRKNELAKQLLNQMKEKFMH